MSVFYIAAAFSMSAGRAVSAETGQGASSGMAFYCVPAPDLPAALAAWLDEMAHIELTPVLLHGCGAFADYDPEYQMFPMEPGEAESMAAQAAESGKIVVSETYVVALPEAEPKRVYLGAAEPQQNGEPGLQEVAVRHSSLAEAITALAATPGLTGIHGLSDAYLADDAAQFDRKPVALAALSLGAQPLGHIQFGQPLL